MVENKVYALYYMNIPYPINKEKKITHKEITQILYENLDKLENHKVI